MKKHFLLITAILIVAVAFISFSFDNKSQQQSGHVIEHESDIAKQEAGTK